jgi:hypothetical protein
MSDVKLMERSVTFLEDVRCMSHFQLCTNHDIDICNELGSNACLSEYFISMHRSNNKNIKYSIKLVINNYSKFF